MNDLLGAKAQMSPVERSLLRSPSIHICISMTLEGNVSAADFDSAVEKLAMRHPLVNCALERSGGEVYFKPRTETLSVQYYQKDSDVTWRDWYATADGKPFDFAHGPLARFGVIFNEGSTDVVILVHHVIADGIGCLTIAKDLLAALDGSLDTTAQIPPTENHFTRGDNPGFLARLAARKLNAAWEKTGVEFSEQDYLRFFEQYRKEFAPDFYLNTIDANSMNDILVFCKKTHITFNEALAAAFSAIVVERSDYFPNNTIRLGIAANIRSELAVPANDCLWNYVSGISAVINIPRGKPFAEIIKAVTRESRKKLNNQHTRHLAVTFLREIDRGLIESIAYGVYGNFDLPVSKRLGSLVAESRENKSLGISNLGKCEMGGYTKFNLQSLRFIPPAFPANLLTVGAITVNGRLSLCLRYNESELKRGEVEEIYDKAVTLLCGK